MRGADLESTPVLLQHLRTRLGVIERELAVATDDAFEDALWAASADLSELRSVVEVLIARQALSRLRNAGDNFAPPPAPPSCAKQESQDHDNCEKAYPRRTETPHAPRRNTYPT